MSLTRSIALVARNHALRNRATQCICERPVSIYSRSQRTTLQQSTIQTVRSRKLHTSTPLQFLRPFKKGVNPYVSIDRYATGAPRKYDLLKLETYREAYHDNPRGFIGFIFISIICLGLAYVNLRWVYEFLLKPTHNYPEDVAKFIRRAMIYEMGGDVKECMKNYQRAITAAEMLQMDPLSDEVTGLKIMYGGVAEKYQAYDKGVEWLERLRLEMLALMEERKEELGTVGWLRIMKRVIGISVKIGDLQMLDKDDANAEKTYEWSIKETIRVMNVQSRLPEGEERPWTVIEIAAIFENMAAFYERTNRFDYATTLYLQAANLFHPPSCHSVILLNNVGACNMQRRLPPSEPMDRETQLESAKKWMEKALDVASEIKPPARTEECDTGCVVALHNIGEVEEQLGRMDEAMLKFMEAQSLAFAIGFTEAYQNSGVAQERIKAKQAGTYISPENRRRIEEAEERKKDEARGLPPLSLNRSSAKKRD